MTTDQQPPGNDMCKCGHSGFEHESGHNICKSCNNCWSFKQAIPPPISPVTSNQPQEQERQQADNRQNSDGIQQLSENGAQQQEQLSGNDEKKFAPYFAAANKEIDELASVASQKKDNIDTELEKSKRKVIQDLANTLRDLGFPVNRIANEIVHQLKGRASKSWILEILDDEYKDKAHQRKRKVGPVADQNRQIMVGVDGHEITGSSEQGSGDLPDEQTKESGSGNLSMHLPPRNEQGIDATVPATKGPAQNLRILIDWDELSDKMAELHYKDIKNFWLCGRTDIKNHKLLDMVLEKEMAVTPSQEEVVEP